MEGSLREQISSGELPPYSQLPSEIALARSFGVSRMTARKAIDQLVAAGLAFRQAGKGTFVVPPKIRRPMFSTQHSFGRAMESLGLEHTTKVLEAKTLSAPSYVATILELPEGAIVVYIKRLRIVEGSPVALHSAYLPGAYAGALEKDLEHSLTDALDEMTVHVASTRDSVEAVSATRSDSTVLGVKVGAPLFKITGTSYTDKGIPARYVEALFRGDRFELLLESSRIASGDIEMTSTFGVLPARARGNT